MPAKASSLADRAQQLKNLPGANINRNGPLTLIAQYRGTLSDRVNMLVAGVRADPNSMDSQLSNIATSRLDSLAMHCVIAPVSSGIETIGGTIAANRKLNR